MGRAPSATTASPPRRWLVLLSAGLIVLAGTLVYANSFKGVFLLDDDNTIVNNPSIRNLWDFGSVLKAPPATTSSGRPMLNLSLAINYALGGLDPWGYHLANLLIHLAAGLTLFGLIRRTLLLPKLHARWGESATTIALATALLWVVHPLQTESVTYIVQRAESLVGLFFLLTFYCVVRSADHCLQASSATQQKTGRLWQCLAVLCCLAGMASKEVMAVAPVLILLYDRLFLAGSWRDALRHRKVVYIGLAASYVLLGLLMVSTGGRNSSVGMGTGISPWDYALSQTRSIVTYLSLSFWPHPLCLDYGTELVAGLGAVWAAAAAVLALLFLTLWAFRRNAMLAFVGCWFFFILAPTSSFIPITQTAAEHRMYLPLAAVILLAVLALHELAGRFASRKAAGAVLAAAVLLAAGLGWATSQRNRLYASDLDIWADTVAKHSSWRSEVSYAQALVNRGRFRQAIPHLDKAIAAEPGNPQAYCSRGGAFLALNRPEEAIKDYSKVLDLLDGQRGDNGIPAVIEQMRLVALNNRADLYRQARRFDLALADLRRLLSLAPDTPEAHLTLAEIYADQGDCAAAGRETQTVLKLGGQLSPHLKQALASRPAR